MFGDEPDLGVSELWESEDAWQQSWDGAVKAAISTAGIEQPEKLTVHEVWGSRVDAWSRERPAARALLLRV